MSPGDVVLVRFPFVEVVTAKKRPALVLARTARSSRNRLATVAMITSQIESLELPGDVMLTDWKRAGLLHPSLLRMAKIATVDESLIEKIIGQLTAEDSRAASLALRLIFSSWLT